jgi:hypothetical protein
MFLLIKKIIIKFHNEILQNLPKLNAELNKIYKKKEMLERCFLKKVKFCKLKTYYFEVYLRVLKLTKKE